MQRRKEHPKQMVLGKCDVHMKKNKSEPTSIHSQWTKDPKAMPEILKLLEENSDRARQVWGKDILDRTPFASGINSDNGHIDHIKGNGHIDHIKDNGHIDHIKASVQQRKHMRRKCLCVCVCVIYIYSKNESKKQVMG